MQQAALSRTEFYRQFNDIYDVVEALIERIASHIEQQAAPWIRDDDAIGHAEIVHDNLVRSARNIQPWGTLLAAVYDAAGLDPRLRTIWHRQLVQPRTEATATAIRRDQKAGAIRDDLDPDATATALYAMSEHLLLDLICRQGTDPDDYARIAAPIWQTVLFTPAAATEADT